MQRLAAIRNLIASDLLIVENGVGTWAHQKIALRVAQKLSTDFAIWGDTKLEELLLTRNTEIETVTPAELLLENAKILVEQEKRLNAIERRMKVIEAKNTTRPDYYTAAGFASLHGKSIGLKEAVSVGKKASFLCRKLDIAIETIPDPRFGIVNMYPSQILQEVFNVQN